MPASSRAQRARRSRTCPWANSGTHLNAEIVIMRCAPCDLRGISRKLVEGRGPAADMAVAALGTEEGPLVEGLDRLAALLFQGDRDERLDARGRAVIPSERENEPFVLDDLAIDAAEPVLAMRRRRDHRAVGTADA